MKITKQRAVILEQLKTHKDHPSADIIYSEVREIIPKISLGTVYRNLEMLSKAGVILKLEYGSGQKKFDPNPNPHTHFRCLECEKVEDIPFKIELPELGTEYLWIKQRKITGINLEYTGYCPACLEK